MAKSVGMAQAKSKLADLVGRAAYKGERIVLERRGRPMAVLIGIDEYNRLQDLRPAADRQGLPAALRERQKELVAQARRLRARVGDPVDGLAKALRTLPPADDAFWLQLAEEPF